MKNILILFSALFFVASASAQVATPRTGTGPNNDNTYRAMTQNWKVVTDAAGNDTAKLNLNAYKTIVKIALVDSVSINFTPITRCYAGDEVQFLVKNSAGGTKVKFVGSNVEGDSGIGSLTLTASKRANVIFTFDGTTWLEKSRVVQ